MEKNLLVFFLIICVLTVGVNNLSLNNLLERETYQSVLPNNNVERENDQNGIQDIRDDLLFYLQKYGLAYVGEYISEIVPLLNKYLSKLLTEYIIYLLDLNVLNIASNLNDEVTFSLFDKTDGSKNFDILKIDDDDLLENSRFDPRRPTVFITHGFLANDNDEFITAVRNAYLKKHDYNVITVNWRPLSFGLYSVARGMIIPIGIFIGKLINFLYKHNMDPNTTTLVGHSLGAHCMAFAGQTAFPKVNHLIGLDPAGPLFERVDNDQKISDDDANHVEIIHTNMGMLGTLDSSSGHYNFFPNGGKYQNGCIENNILDVTCSHMRAIIYLVEQIEQQGPSFVAVQCDSYENFKKGRCSNNTKAIMGAVDLGNTKRGSYYLDTNKKSPFAMGNNFP